MALAKLVGVVLSGSAVISVQKQWQSVKCCFTPTCCHNLSESVGAKSVGREDVIGCRLTAL